MKNAILKYMFPLIGTAGLLFAGCTEEVDNEYTRFQYVMEMTASADEIVLNDETPDDVALTIAWTEPVDYGSDVLTTYEYQWYLQGSGLTPGSEYEDMGNFTRTYTHAELQDIMVNDFNCLTSTWGTMEFTATASFEGTSGQIILDDEASVTVRIKTYGDKQFAADRVFISGTAVGSENIELTASESNTDLYVYNGELSAGKFNFPVVYGDENNVIIPSGGADVNIGEEAMDATVVGNDETMYSWVISEADSYRVTLNFSNQTVTVIRTADIMEIDNLYMAGDAVGSEEIEITQTLENEAVYAWKGELSAGTLYFPIEFEGERNLTMVPSDSENHSVLVDGTDNSFTTVTTVSATGRYWEIPSNDTYRIIIDVDARTVKIYSAENDLQPRYANGTWSNGSLAGYGTTPAENTVEIECLWMYGPFDGFADDSGVGQGFQFAYRCIRSLADPYVFVYSGDALPRNTDTAFAGSATKTVTGGVVFIIGPESPLDGSDRFESQSVQTPSYPRPYNNSYAFGSADVNSVRNSRCESFAAVLGTAHGIEEGQDDSRYGYFEIPSGCNHVVVDTRNMTVTFSQK